MIDIRAIQTNKGYFISCVPNTPNTYVYRNYDNLLFDGVRPSPSFHKDWSFIFPVPKKVSRLVNQPNINHRFVLIDDSLVCTKIPLTIRKDDAGETRKTCEGDKFFWKDELAIYQSLYVEVSDTQPDREEQLEFTFTVLFKVGDILPPPLFVYPKVSVLPEHQELDKIIFPTVLLHETPSRLSSKASYDIVRQHVKTHIDPKVATLQSDYDFCFAVNKIIPLAEPHTVYLTETRGSRKITTPKLISVKSLPCFEMTYSPENYKGYTPIQGFEGRDESELKIQIDTYLTDLMAIINKPLRECPQCKGNGVIG